MKGVIKFPFMKGFFRKKAKDNQGTRTDLTSVRNLTNVENVTIDKRDDKPIEEERLQDVRECPIQRRHNEDSFIKSIWDGSSE